MTEKITKKRFAELDILRGFAVFLMIVCDAAPAEMYFAFQHSDWEGLTLADLGFPLFVFAMGVSTAFSASRRLPNFKKFFKRSTILFLLGIFFYNQLPFIFAFFLWTDFSSADFFSQAVEHGRFFGILQRLALTYFFGMCLIKFLQSDKKILFASCGLLILSSLGFHIYAPENPFAVEKNIYSALDLNLVGENHLLTPTHDPEGFYGTFASTAEFLFGFLAGKILLKNISVQEKIYKLLAGGGIIFAVGIIWSNFDIISKNLWTSPYALITAGIEIFMLAGLLKISQTNLKNFLKPFQALGKNPLFFFFAAYLGLVFFLVLKIEDIPAWYLIYQYTFQGLGSTEFSSMIFCFAWCGIWMFVAEILDKKNIIIKI